MNTIQSLISKNSEKTWFFVLTSLVLLSFAIRVFNLNYNTAFTDEASSILVGNLGVFQGDWWTYNAFNWMSGNPLINPVLSAIGYVSGGLWGSRFISVIFGALTVELIVVLTLLLNGATTIKGYISGLIAGTVVTFAPVSLFISRLATYDIKSFYLLFLSLAVLIWTEINNKNLGKWYFLAFITLFLALLAKVIVLIYIPLFIGYSFYKIKNNKEKKYFWFRYFFIPLIVVSGTYLMMTLYYMFSFAGLQASKETWQVVDILKRIFIDIKDELFLGFIGSILMLLNNQWKKLLILLFSGAWILAAHIVTGRAIWTMDKQIFITVVFLAIITGIGFSNLIYYFKNRVARISLALLTGILLSFYSVHAYATSKDYNDLWQNSSSTATFLSDHIQSGDMILSETGAPIIVALYDKNFPSNTTTFDYFSYGKFKGKEAYAHAVRDGYFDWIELINENKPKEPALKQISITVKKNLNDNYKQVYKDINYTVYKKEF